MSNKLTTDRNYYDDFEGGFVGGIVNTTLFISEYLSTAQLNKATEAILGNEALVAFDGSRWKIVSLAQSFHVDDPDDGYFQTDIELVHVGQGSRLIGDGIDSPKGIPLLTA